MSHYNVLFLCTGNSGAFDHGRGDHESQREHKLHGLQCGESSHWSHAARGYSPN